MLRSRRLGLVLLVAASAASLLGLPLVRRAEQLPAPLLLLADALLASGLPAVPAPDAQDLLAAQQAWDLWLADMGGGVGTARGSLRGLIVPVVGGDRARHEIVLRVPAGAVPLGAAVSHRGVLLGCVSRVEAGTGNEGERALARLVGDRSVRPIAGEWRVGPEGRAAHFLARGEAAPGPARAALLDLDGEAPSPVLSVVGASTSVRPPPGQLAWTRDVAFLGDDLPPGLLLGRVVWGEEEDKAWIEPVLDAFALDHVVVEARADAVLPVPVAEGHLTGAGGGSRGRLRLRLGSRDGVHAGDLVAQQGVLVGLVETAGLLSSVVGPPPESLPLLVIGQDGEVVPRARSDVGGLAGGERVVAGHLLTGGLFAGRVAEVDAEGWRLARAPVCPDAPVLVLRR